MAYRQRVSRREALAQLDIYLGRIATYRDNAAQIHPQSRAMFLDRLGRIEEQINDIIARLSGVFWRRPDSQYYNMGDTMQNVTALYHNISDRTQSNIARVAQAMSNLPNAASGPSPISTADAISNGPTTGTVTAFSPAVAAGPMNQANVHHVVAAQPQAHAQRRPLGHHRHPSQSTPELIDMTPFNPHGYPVDQQAGPSNYVPSRLLHSASFQNSGEYYYGGETSGTNHDESSASTTSHDSSGNNSATGLLRRTS